MTIQEKIQSEIIRLRKRQSELESDYSNADEYLEHHLLNNSLGWVEAMIEILRDLLKE